MGAKGFWDSLPVVDRQCAVYYTDFWAGSKKKSFPSDTNLWRKILAKLLISKDSITPFSKGYLVW